MDTLEVLILKELSLNEQSVDFGLATIQLRAHGTGDRRWSGVILSHRLDGHDWSGDVLHMAGETDDGRRVEGSALAWTQVGPGRTAPARD